MNFEPSQSTLEAWLDNTSCRDTSGVGICNRNGKSKCNDCNNCNIRTFFVSSPRVLPYLSRTTHVSRVFLDLSFLSRKDMMRFVSIVASPPHNIRHIVVRFMTNDHDMVYHCKLMDLLNELHQQKINHLRTLSFHNTTPLANSMLPLLRKVLLANDNIKTLKMAFDTIDPTIACFLVDVVSQGLALLQKLHLTFLSQPESEQAHDREELHSAWSNCFKRSAAVSRQIDTVHVTGYSALYFLSGIFPNITCNTMSCHDHSPTIPQILQEKDVIAMFHHCIQLKLKPCTSISFVAPAILSLQTLTLDVRHVRALDDDIAADIIQLLSHDRFPTLRHLTLFQRSMTNSQFLTFCALFHHGHDHHNLCYPNLSSLTLNVELPPPKLDDECRSAYLQIIRTCPAMVACRVSFLSMEDEYDHTRQEAHYLLMTNKMQIPRLLRLHNNDDGVSDTTKTCLSPSLWPHILSALHPHPSILFTLLKEKSSELIPHGNPS